MSPLQELHSAVLRFKLAVDRVDITRRTDVVAVDEQTAAAAALRELTDTGALCIIVAQLAARVEDLRAKLDEYVESDNRHLGESGA